MNSLPFTNEVDIWRGRIRPSIFIPDSILPKGSPVAAPEDEHGAGAGEAAATSPDPRVQVVLSKGNNGRYGQASVASIRGCIDAVVSTYFRLYDKQLTVNALVKEIVPEEWDTRRDSVRANLNRMNRGQIVTLSTAKNIARGLSVALKRCVNLDQLVEPLGNEVGTKLIEDGLAAFEARLASYPLKVKALDPSPASVNGLATTLAGDEYGIPSMDLDEEFHISGTLEGYDAANRALDMFRTVLRHGVSIAR